MPTLRDVREQMLSGAAVTQGGAIVLDRSSACSTLTAWSCDPIRFLGTILSQVFPGALLQPDFNMKQREPF